jgi:hypothetical protein
MLMRPALFSTQGIPLMGVNPFGPNAKLRLPGWVEGFLEMWGVLLMALAIAGVGVAFLIFLRWLDQPKK